MGTGRNAVAIRLLKLYRRVYRETYISHLSDLARELGVCERTIRRDLEAMEAAGYQVPKWRHFPSERGTGAR